MKQKLKFNNCKVVSGIFMTVFISAARAAESTGAEACWLAFGLLAISAATGYLIYLQYYKELPFDKSHPLYEGKREPEEEEAKNLRMDNEDREAYPEGRNYREKDEMRKDTQEQRHNDFEHPNSVKPQGNIASPKDVKVRVDEESSEGTERQNEMMKKKATGHRAGSKKDPFAPKDPNANLKNSKNKHKEVHAKKINEEDNESSDAEENESSEDNEDSEENESSEENEDSESESQEASHTNVMRKGHYSQNEPIDSGKHGKKTAAILMGKK
ncbi:unnamed protein product [Moneuplotes crassus]|uniref:Uncharacterized protein n=1 Tax=Euplotes crassus TaxID=5936 RepID=A0AAD1XLS0_EUPCR|nr:unnamed protein product [Moneuplotes crassus]